MLTNGRVTFFCYNPQTDAFENCGSFPAWTVKKRRIRNSGSAVYRCDTFNVRIELKNLPEVSPGDLICFRETASAAPDLSLCRRIASVTENNFGTAPHIHIEAEYDYR